MLSTGQADANTMGWMEGMEGWKALNSDEFAFLGIQSAPPVANASTPSLRQKSSDGSPAQDPVQANSSGDSGTFAIGSAISRLFNFQGQHNRVRQLVDLGHYHWVHSHRSTYRSSIGGQFLHFS